MRMEGQSRGGMKVSAKETVWDIWGNCGNDQEALALMTMEEKNDRQIESREAQK